MTISQSKLIKSVVPSLAAVLLANVGAFAQDGELVYHERFVNTTGANAPFENGWMAYLTDAEAGTAINVTTETPSGFTTALTGDPGAELTFDDNDLGAIFFYRAAPLPFQVSYLTEQVDIDMSGSEITELTWWNKNNPQSVGQDVRNHILLKIGGQWYVTNDYRVNTDPGPRVWQKQSLPISPAAENWSTFVLEEDTQMGVGDPLTEPLPAGNIEGVGFYTIGNISSGDSNHAVLVDELKIFASESTGGGKGPGLFSDYDLVDGWVDSGDFMGWVYVVNYPWVSVLNFDGKYIYADESSWVYIPK